MERWPRRRHGVQVSMDAHFAETLGLRRAPFEATLRQGLDACDDAVRARKPCAGIRPLATVYSKDL